MMLKFCEAFLRHRKAVVALFAVAAVACALCIPAVKVNYSMTDYLPADAPSIQALDDMEQSFDGGIPNARLFAEGIDQATAEQLSRDLAAVDGGQVAGKLLGRGLVDALGEQTRVRDAPVERLLHVVERLYRRRVGRQVIGHAVVHLHRRDAQRARHCRHREQRNHRLAVAQERFAKLEHHAPFEQMFHVKHSYHR